MKCNKDRTHTVVENEALGKKFWYCRQCKDEVTSGRDFESAAGVYTYGAPEFNWQPIMKRKGTASVFIPKYPTNPRDGQVHLYQTPNGQWYAEVWDAKDQKWKQTNVPYNAAPVTMPVPVPHGFDKNPMAHTLCICGDINCTEWEEDYQ